MGNLQFGGRHRCCGLGVESLTSPRNKVGLTAVVVLVTTWGKEARRNMKFTPPEVQLTVSEPESASRGGGTTVAPTVRIKLSDVVVFRGVQKVDEIVDVQIVSANSQSSLIATGSLRLDADLPATEGMVSEVKHCRVQLDYSSSRTLYEGSLSFSYRVERG